MTPLYNKYMLLLMMKMKIAFCNFLGCKDLRRTMRTDCFLNIIFGHLSTYVGHKTKGAEHGQTVRLHLRQRNRLMDDNHLCPVRDLRQPSLSCRRPTDGHHPEKTEREK